MSRSTDRREHHTISQMARRMLLKRSRASLPSTPRDQAFHIALTTYSEMPTALAWHPKLSDSHYSYARCTLSCRPMALPRSPRGLWQPAYLEIKYASVGLKSHSRQDRALISYSGIMWGHRKLVTSTIYVALLLQRTSQSKTSYRSSLHTS